MTATGVGIARVVVPSPTCPYEFQPCVYAYKGEGEGVTVDIVQLDLRSAAKGATVGEVSMQQGWKDLCMLAWLQNTETNE